MRHPLPHASLSIALFALLSGMATGASFQFGEPVGLTDGLTVPNSVCSVDLDGDGSLDLLASSSYDDVEVWYRNLGSGVFGEKQVLGGSFPDPDYLKAADLNGDGIVDVYGGSKGDRTVHWYQGMGNGEFADPVVLLNTSVHSLNLVQAADLDSDGDLDLLVGRTHAGLRWHENLGGGLFVEPATLVVPQVVVATAQMADMDGDGLLDLVYDDIDTDTLVFQQGLGAGSFGPAIVLAVGVSWASQLQLVDFNGSGNLDVIYFHASDDRVYWIAGLGAAGFGMSQTLIEPDSMISGTLELCDLDGDQDLDLGYSSAMGLSWVENLGAGQFAAPSEVLATGPASDLACGDFDGDGHQDLAFTSLADQLSWTSNLGSGAAFSFAMPVSSFVADPSESILADVDGDGDLDALGLAGTAGRIFLFENIGGGEFATGSLLVVGEGSSGRLRAGDLDEDGDLDLLWQAYAGDAIRWLEQQGSLTWAPPADLAPLPNNPRDIELCDFGLDGDLDIVQIQVSPDKIRIYENLGQAQFAGPMAQVPVGTPKALAVGALTSSGRPDLVVRAEDGRISWFRNFVGISFDAPKVIVDATGGDPIEDVALADLSGNGRLDLLWTQSGSVRWKVNLGNGAFGPNNASYVGVHTESLKAADLDTDGDSDLVITSTWDNVITVENTGGQFGSPQEVPDSSEQAWKPATGDIDGDGDIDLLLTYYGTDSLEWRSGEILAVVGTSYCGPAVPNSTGQPGIAFSSGSLESTSNNFTLHARQLPLSKVGIFLASPNQGLVTSVPGSVGTLCLGASIGRFNMSGQVLVTSQAGTASLPIDLDAIATPTGTAPVQPGETWNFQFWHRDEDPTTTSNFTQGVSVHFQ